MKRRLWNGPGGRACLLSLALTLACWVTAPAQPDLALPLNRFYLTIPTDAQVHFYSTDTNVPAFWMFERVEGYVSPYQTDYSVPLYRLYNDRNYDHVYTTREGEVANLPSLGYTQELVVGHVVPADRLVPGTVPLYRFWRGHEGHDRNYADHFYSLSPTVPRDYTAEGVCCRVWKDRLNIPEHLLRVFVNGANGKLVQGGVQSITWSIWTGGGVLRVSYSVTGHSWTRIAFIPVPLNYGEISHGSYNWKPPADLTGPLWLKLDWLESPNSTAMPWASAETNMLSVTKALVVPPIKIPPRKK
jgi:hypothetical protein